jgi:hypothetical protein
VIFHLYQYHISSYVKENDINHGQQKCVFVLTEIFPEVNHNEIM